MLLVLIGAAFLGGIYTEVSITEFGAMNTLSSLVIGMTTMLSHIGVFSTTKAAYWREASTGINRLAYFLAADFAQWPIILVIPVMYLSVFYTLTTPQSSFGIQYGILLATVFCTSGAWLAVAQLLSVMLFRTRIAVICALFRVLMQKRASPWSHSRAGLHDLVPVQPEERPNVLCGD